jgi:TonB family protein
MQSKFYLASFIACFLCLNSFAQKKQNVYFLKDNGRYVDLKDSADYIRIIQEPDSGSVLYHVLEYYPKGNIRLIGKTTTTNPVKLQGATVSFYLNKNKKRVVTYENGAIVGQIYDYYPNGKLYRSMEYLEWPKFNPTLPPPTEREEIVHGVFDSTGVQTVTDGNGHYSVFSEDYKEVEEEGELVNGKRNGTWKGNVSKTQLRFIEDYADGKFIKGISTDAAGSIKNYTVKEALPTFIGGERAFGQYLSNAIKYPLSAAQNNIQGKVILSFAVEKDGSLTDIKIISHVSKEIDAEAYRVISQSTRWNPGLQHGVPVKVSYTMPINFTIQGN